MLKGIFVVALLACFFFFMASEGAIGPRGEGGTGTPGATGGTTGTAYSGGGGGSRAPDIENFIRQVESWKTDYKDRFEYLQKLLYKPAFTSTKYAKPGVWIYYPTSENTTVNRTDNIEIRAIILNTNPIEIRRALYLTLEVQEPGEGNFKPAPRTGVQIIQTNEYHEKQNTSWRIFPELTSLKFLKEVGNIKFRIRWTDGEDPYYSSGETSYPAQGYYSELALRVKNIPPRINNSTMRLYPEIARWDDYIRYTAYLENIENGQVTAALAGKDENLIQITLHIFNKSNEVFTTTKQFLAEDMILFSTRDVNGMFKEVDAGSNFTYRYSCTDGIMGGDNTTWSAFGEGPHIKPNPKIKVSDPMMFCEDENYYWWQWYTFGMRVKNLNPIDSDVTFTLYTKTGDNPWKWIEKKAVKVSQASNVIYFNNTRPFIANDANALFSYRINFSEYDEEGKNSIEAYGTKINPKIMPYAIYHPIMLSNLALVFVFIVGGCLFVERKLQRGIESQEGLSLKAKVRKGKSKDRSINDVLSKISKTIRGGRQK